MTTALLAFLIMLSLVAMMAVGVLLGRKPIAGSCGGLKTLGLAGDCEVCGGDPGRCDPEAAQRLARDATQPGPRGADGSQSR